MTLFVDVPSVQLQPSIDVDKRILARRELLFFSSAADRWPVDAHLTTQSCGVKLSIATIS